ncbi:MAG: (E)-4-hydroxy-3-methylbut-2-enyl-diphosphate synthase [Proteobacteria bacterium]|nr:(E)-4-hydroxy-3-methylbut-2-enyl-diphosphate synthase [Pseudomonadota bacterium]MBT5793465.1 (E)-4-hydroxy-3-methylbut-2-enyl-diphosphate synthase [Deltaproteobacteria bacterium]
MLPKRRQASTVSIGSIKIGGTEPIRIQSMLTSDTTNVEACIVEIAGLDAVDCEIIRLTVPNQKSVDSLPAIRAEMDKRGIKRPLVADVHFNPQLAINVCEFVEKVRINPGNFVDRKKFEVREYTDQQYQQELARVEEKMLPLIKNLKKYGCALRIGTNHGSLSDRVMNRFGDNSEGMVESALEYLRILRKHDFEETVLSMKSSNPLVMIQAYRQLVQVMDKENMYYPLHLGVTEAGNELDGRIKSAVGIGTLLCEGLGDTIRVSLTEASVNEIPVAQSILQSTRARIYNTDFISCPSCGRTFFDLESTTSQIKARTSHLKGVKIAIMGCVVNGPGEMADADFGYVGAGPGKISLYHGHTCVERNIPSAQAVERLIELIKEQGKWVSPA